MVLKREYRETDVEALARKFRQSWSEGEVIRSWLRGHGEELRNLVRQEDWSWENIGKALSLAEIQFKTGKGWTGENVRRAVDLAMKPRKGRGKPQATLSAPPASTTWPAESSRVPPPSPQPPGESEFRIIRRGPGSSRGADDPGATASGQSKRGEP